MSHRGFNILFVPPYLSVFVNADGLSSLCRKRSFGYFLSLCVEINHFSYICYVLIDKDYLINVDDI
ncbi:hypothetical protein HMPREF9445_03246 [Bacteroides clarus YIT 12056]|uniref:Uncharacterized protein n=1 Tax=Bacteroides clarus YIT 12056 TaxID=762984 RepID=A0ABN0CKT8_9BACE|nr:hypothetical protein HMPREF9445_03246 [Bacteroides clarus YIT 12056]